MKRNTWIIVVVVLAVCAVCAALYFTNMSGKVTSKEVSSSNTTALGMSAASAPEASGTLSHRQASQSSTPALSQPWLELPAGGMGITCNSEGLSEGDDMHLVTHHATMQGRRQRNYTCFYDADTYVSYWVAYPLCASHISTGREEVWGYDEKVPVEEQTSVKKGYGASIPTANYPKNFYARGHQIPNADRNAVPEMMAQTYFSTNMTPQIQNGMNGGLWAKLEEAIRNETPISDTLYVITGSTFRVRGDEEIKTIVNKNDGKTLLVPNYYWKAALKVRRTESGLSEAVTIGFWVPHNDLKGRNYTEFAVPVDSLEALTGFDLFVNLPDKMETAAETNGSWETFCAFSR